MSIEDLLRRSRVLAVALVGSVLTLVVIAGLIPGWNARAFTFLVNPTALLGLVSPVIGYRLFLWQRDRRTESPDRAASYARALLLSLAATEGIAVLGIVVHVATSRPFPLVGVLTHVLLAGALWPTREKIEDWVDDAGATS